MKTLLDLLLTRRSIRQYTDQAVSDFQIDQILRAGMAAPSAGNQQPWHFVVIRDRNTLNAIPDTFHPYAQMLHEAPAGIVICGDTSLEKYKDFWIQDCSAATQNMLIAAHALGLGSVWLGLHPNPERAGGMKKLLSLPETVIPLSMIALGYAKNPTLASIDRFQKERIHQERW